MILHLVSGGIVLHPNIPHGKIKKLPQIASGHQRLRAVSVRPIFAYLRALSGSSAPGLLRRPRTPNPADNETPKRKRSTGPQSIRSSNPMKFPISKKTSMLTKEIGPRKKESMPEIRGSVGRRGYLFISITSRCAKTVFSCKMTKSPGISSKCMRISSKSGCANSPPFAYNSLPRPGYARKICALLGQ